MHLPIASTGGLGMRKRQCSLTNGLCLCYNVLVIAETMLTEVQ
jgi:hypothetical protein